MDDTDLEAILDSMLLVLFCLYYHSILLNKILIQIKNQVKITKTIL